ncbi:lysozyme family protein [Oceanobacillus sp. Castelsardo]|uniref:lysozyme family protein n=1 Tax=Oceanobacillus sp. Castelsardo TaxID=1851204 RepID=UPI000837D1CA|nr:lysozyme family protein [Oceanobacillus sp. Castelsardo]
MKRKKKAKRLIGQVFFICIVLFGAMSFISILSMKGNVDNLSKMQEGYPQITKEVQNYRPLVEKYAKEYEVTPYIDVLLAVMMQESGGRGKDPMQSSESFCGKVGCIKDPEQSIKQGVYYFSEVLNDAKGDLKLAIQSYNFGRGFINYVLEETGSYSEEIAIDFSQKMYENASDKSIYSCLRKEAKQYNACYGDIYYVQSVMKYKEGLALE